MEAVPILLRRVAAQVSPNFAVQALPPIRVHRTGILTGDLLERAVEFAARQSGEQGRILILLDADDDCPKELAAEMLRRAEAARQDRIIQPNERPASANCGFRYGCRTISTLL